ncbi:MAG: HpcH/HpaI aldolase family protein [Chloroflexota bacterium]
MADGDAPNHVNPVRALLREDRATAGLMVTMASPQLAQTLAASGMDWLVFDMEHGMISVETLHAMIAATAGTSCAPLARVPWNVNWLVKPVLDAGAMGIMFPMVMNSDDVRAAVSSTRYPENGDRGWGPLYSSMRWGMSRDEYVRRADAEIVRIFLIEHPEAVKNIEDIVRVDGVDVIVPATFDLSVNMGYLDGPDHPDVQEAVGKIQKAARNAGVPLGGWAWSTEQGNERIEQGYRMLAFGFDVTLVGGAVSELLTGLER